MLGPEAQVSVSSASNGREGQAYCILVLNFPLIPMILLTEDSLNWQMFKLIWQIGSD